MQTFLEFAHQTQHPLHNDATKNGFNHEGTSSAAGVATHTYTHPKGHSLTLHTSSNGGHTFNLKTKHGKELKGSTAGHFMGATLHTQ